MKTRYAQQVRNHLIFGFNGGAGEPACPLYSLDLVVTEVSKASAVVQVGRRGRAYRRRDDADRILYADRWKRCADI